MHFPCPAKRLLVTGASGFLGWNLCRLAATRWQTHGTFQQHPVDIAGVVTHAVDLTDDRALAALVEKIAPHAVIHTAAATNPNTCEMEPERSARINLQATVRLGNLCAGRGLPLVFTSTDLVFDGLHPPYSEQDPVRPTNVYATHKAAAETALQRDCPGAVICRLPLLFGRGAPAAGGFFAEMLRRMRLGMELRLFDDEYRTPVSAETAARGLLLALERGKGILHLGGRERISRYEFGELAARILGFSQAKLVRTRQRDVVLPAARPPDVSLDSGYAYSLGYAPPSLEDEFMRLRKSL